MMPRLARVILAVAILIATQGALLHPLAHLGETGHAHASAAAGGCDHDDSPSVAHACDLCVAFNPLTASIDGTAPFSGARVDGLRARSAHGTLHEPRAPPAFRSRDPPALS